MEINEYYDAQFETWAKTFVSEKRPTTCNRRNIRTIFSNFNVLKSVRLKFLKRSAEKFKSRTPAWPAGREPESEANRDLRVIFPVACSEKSVQGSAPGFIPFNF